jgi:hypothetical protein
VGDGAMDGDFLTAGFLAGLDDLLAPADAQIALFPGEVSRRQPVHTVYVPANLYRADTPRQWGEQALTLLDEHTPTPARFAGATGLAPAFVDEVLPRVRAKLAAQPVEDLRVDFEDGYRARDDADEDAAATAAGTALASLDGPGSPILTGLRIKSLQASTRGRGLRTLDLLVRAATEAGGLPERFVVTLPKVAHVAEVSAAVQVCERLEKVYGLRSGALRFELQIELPQAVVGPDGTAPVARLVHAGEGRCEGLHYGTYDFSAAAGVVALEQSLDHPLADHAKAVMQLAAAQTGIRISDGSTNIIPTGSYDSVIHAWQVHARLVQRALRRAIFQGWDMHPGHLVTRYAATYEFYRMQLQPSAFRLGHYVREQASGVMDEPATAVALAGVILRALDCDATDDDEVRELCGLERPALLTLARRPVDLDEKAS